MADPQARKGFLGWLRWAWNPPADQMVADHEFVHVDWMPDCGYLAHPQANRCGKPKRYHNA